MKKKSHFAVFFFGFIIASICNNLNQLNNREKQPKTRREICICDGNQKSKKKLKTLQIFKQTYSDK